jgi:TonB family protein
MAARAEISTNAQGPGQQPSAPAKGMSVALIGPNDAHRKVVAKALAGAEGRKVHEFIDYPADLSDLARMMETRFDVVLVDVDTDESYAIQIITKLAELGPAVMAYSARSDEDLVANCMRAGANDFLPLPSEEQPGTEPAQAPARVVGASVQAAQQPVPSMPQSAPKPVTAAPQTVAKAVTPAPQAVVKPSAPMPPTAPRQAVVVPQPAAARPVETPSAPISRPNVTPIAVQKLGEAETFMPPLRAPEARPMPVPESSREPMVKPEALDILKDEGKDDFAAWDAVNLRRASMPPVTRPDSRPRPALVPERRKIAEPVVAPIVPEAEEPVKEAVAPAPPPPVAPVIERPPISSDIFRSSAFHSEPSEAAEKQGANWVKWMLIAAGPVVLGLVLLVVFTRSSTPGAASAAAKTTSGSTPAAEPVKPDATASDRLIVNATGKPSDNPAVKSRKDLTGEGNQAPATAADTETPVEVSPDSMAAQLVAPTRIAGQIKTKPPVDEPPPAAPAAVALEDGNAVPGSVFSSGSKVKVAPHVVPISAGLAAGMLIHRTTPIYPKYAQDAHITGTVNLKATITKQGTIEGIQVISGPKILAPPAIDAVKTWKYRPYLLDGQPVAVETNITVVFGGGQ